MVDEKQRTIGAKDDQILAAGIAEVQEERGRGGVEYCDTAFFRDVFETAAAIFVEAIGKAAWLTDIDFIEAVAINISDGDAVVAVDVDTGSAIQMGAPVGDAVAELAFERIDAFEGMRGNFAKKRSRGCGDGLFERGPTRC
jgi:hypothetical protein